MNYILFFLIILLGRINSSLLGYQFLNTDEFIIGSKAHRIVNNHFNITEFDGDTVGILNALFLTWPDIFGFDITYLSIRLTSIIILSLISLILFKIINIFLNKKISIFLITPYVFFISFTKDPDFLHYNNEIISTLLILFSLLIYFKNYNNLNRLNCFLFSFALGLVLFAKMQFFPIACLIIFIVNIRFFILDKEYDCIIWSVASFIFPAIFFSIYYFYNNEFIDLYYNVIHYPLSDLLIRNNLSEINIIYPKNNLTNILSGEKRNLFFSHLILNSVFHYIYLHLIFFICLILIIKKNKINLDIIKIFFDAKFVLVFLVIIFTFLVILITGSVHRHYLVNFLPFVPISLAVFINFYFKNLDNQIKIFLKYNKIFFSLIFIFFISLILEKKKFFSNNFHYEKIALNEFHFNSPEIFQYLKLNKNKDKLIVWGWKPEIYLLSGLVPATRDLINQKQIDYKSNRSYFRERFIKDFKKNPPNIVLDYVKENGYFFNNPKIAGVNSFEALANELDNNYKKINLLNEECPSIYLKKENFYLIKDNLVDFSITFEDYKIRVINDFSFDEEICKTSYFFSDKSSDHLLLDLNSKKKIQLLSLLSSKENNKEIELDVLFISKKKLLFKKKIILKKYPFWTNLKIDSDKEIDQISIRLDTLKSNKFGLNEVKLF